jgi:3-isopropylmalate/(R)-2-methylmalate dehydratase small subunit
MRFGIRCVIAPSFGEIFRENAFQNGLLPVMLDGKDCAALGAALEHARSPLVTVDLEHCVVRGPGGWTRSFSVPPERRMALLEGLDEIDVILRKATDIDVFQRADRQRRPWIYIDRGPTLD